jgi:hypothetical protein
MRWWMECIENIHHHITWEISDEAGEDVKIDGHDLVCEKDAPIVKGRRLGPIFDEV